MEHLSWLIEATGPDLFYNQVQIVLPDAAFFTAGRGTDHETALAVVDDVKRLMGISHWPTMLERMPALPPDLRHTYQSTSETAGTFQLTEDGALIRYQPDMMEQPIVFISVMAHELSHYLLSPVWDQAPGGPEQHELMTDLTAVAMGFGIFQVMAADALGWSGYLSQETRAFALALIVRAKGIDPDIVAAALARRPLKLFRDAVAMVDRNPEDVEVLLAMKPG